MTNPQKRQIVIVISAAVAIFALITVAVLVVDFRTLMKIALPKFQVGADEPYDEPYYDEEYIGPDEFTMPSGVAMRGSIERQQTVTGTIGMTRMEGWTLVGRVGDQFLLDFEPLGGGYTWQMEVYGPDRQLFAFTMDSDAGYADFTQLEIELPEDGTYTIVLSAFGVDGKYRLAIY